MNEFIIYGAEAPFFVWCRAVYTEKLCHEIPARGLYKKIVVRDTGDAVNMKKRMLVTSSKDTDQAKKSYRPRKGMQIKQKFCIDRVEGYKMNKKYA